MNCRLQTTVFTFAINGFVAPTEKAMRDAWRRLNVSNAQVHKYMHVSVTLIFPQHACVLLSGM
jgi:hypothetical protein